MSITSQIKAMVRRILSTRARRDETEADVTDAAPLVQLLHEVEPPPDLFTRIEAGLDGEALAAQGRGLDVPLRRTLTPFVLGTALGFMVAWTAIEMLSDRHQVLFQPTSSAPLLPLGHVTVHGSELRTLLHAKCRDYPHFSIAVDGQARPTGSDHAATDVPLRNSGEKILIACIF